MNVQVNAKSAAKSVLEFVKQAGGIAKNTEALELVARICGFDSYRAMRAVSYRDQAPSKVVGQLPSARSIETPGRVAFRSPMIDWEWDENPDANLEFIPERRRCKFEIVVEDFSPQFRICVRPVGVDLDNYHGKSVLDLQLEIHDGLPAVSISNDPGGDMLLKVFGASAGLLVRKDEGESLTLDKAPASLQELARRNGLEDLTDSSMWAVKNDTFAQRTHTDMLVTAIAEDALKAARASSGTDIGSSAICPVNHPVDEAVADLSKARDPSVRNQVIHVKFDTEAGGDLTWLDVCFVNPDGSSDVSESTAGYTSFGKFPVDRPARRAFADAIATVAAYFACEGDYKYMNELIREVMVRQNALDLALTCKEIVSKTLSVHLACDAIEAVLSVLPKGLVLAGHVDGCLTAVCRHCDSQFSLEDEGIYLGEPCPSSDCPSHKL